MKILVTGGEGQLGKSLQKIRGEYPMHDFLFTDLPETDITDTAAIDALFQEFPADVIVNCAAYTAVDKAEEDREKCMTVNATGPGTLAKIAADHDMALVHISTDYVFDGKANLPLNESYPVAPLNFYGLSKLRGEDAVRESGANSAIIRTSWLYSEFGHNFVRTMLRIGKNSDTIRVVYDQAGTPTYATDLAHAVMKLIERGITGSEIYHYSNEGVASWYDFAKAIFEIKGMDIKVEPIESHLYPTPASRPAYSVLSKEKIKAAGTKVPYWRHSLEKCIEILKNEC